MIIKKVLLYTLLAAVVLAPGRGVANYRNEETYGARFINCVRNLCGKGQSPDTDAEVQRPLQQQDPEAAKPDLDDTSESQSCWQRCTSFCQRNKGKIIVAGVVLTAATVITVGVLMYSSWPQSAQDPVTNNVVSTTTSMLQD